MINLDFDKRKGLIMSASYAGKAEIRDASRASTSIGALDLEYLLPKLEEAEWHDDELQKAIANYKQFLMLCFLHPDQILVPPKNVAKVWQTHVTFDTRRYQKDCDNIFRHFLHHNANLGLSDDEEKGAVEICREQTLRLYIEHFGNGEVE